MWLLEHIGQQGTFPSLQKSLLDDSALDWQYYGIKCKEKEQELVPMLGKVAEGCCPGSSSRAGSVSYLCSPVPQAAPRHWMQGSVTPQIYTWRAVSVPHEHTHIYTNLHTCNHTLTYVLTHVYKYTHPKFTYIHTHTHTYINTCTSFV